MLIVQGVGDTRNVVATAILRTVVAPFAVCCDRRLGCGLFAVTAFAIATLRPENTAALSYTMIVALCLENTATLSDPIIAVLRPECFVAPSDSMLAALLQQLNLLALLVTARAEEDIADSRSFVAQMTALTDCLDRLEHSQTDLEDCAFSDLQSFNLAPIPPVACSIVPPLTQILPNLQLAFILFFIHSNFRSRFNHVLNSLFRKYCCRSQFRRCRLRPNLIPYSRLYLYRC